MAGWESGAPFPGPRGHCQTREAGTAALSVSVWVLASACLWFRFLFVFCAGVFLLWFSALVSVLLLAWVSISVRVLTGLGCRAGLGFGVGVDFCVLFALVVCFGFCVVFGFGSGVGGGFGFRILFRLWLQVVGSVFVSVCCVIWCLFRFRFWFSVLASLVLSALVSELGIPYTIYLFNMDHM